MLRLVRRHFLSEVSVRCSESAIENLSVSRLSRITRIQYRPDESDMQAFSERRKYCANCGREIRPGQEIELDRRYTVCSEECKREFMKGKSS